MARTTVAPYRCTDCGWTSPKWVGRCGECQAWGTVEEVGAVRARTTAKASVVSPAVRIGEVDVATARAVPTGIPELDRVLGGGFVPGAVLLLAGEPGVGKSTFIESFGNLVIDQGHKGAVLAEEGSTARTAGRWPRSMSHTPSASMKVDFPAPGTPEIPSRTARPVLGRSAASTCCARRWWSARVDSTSVMALASARRWPASTPSTSAWSAAVSGSCRTRPRDPSRPGAA